MIESLTVQQIAAAARRHIADHAGYACGYVGRSATAAGARMLQDTHRRHCLAPVITLPLQPVPADVLLGTH